MKWKLRDISIAKSFLGIRIDQSNGRISLDLEEYIDKLLVKFNMTDCDISELPGSPAVILSKDQCPKTEEEKKQMAKKPYRALIGSLLFCATTLVPEIAERVNHLSEFMQNPGMAHWEEAKRVIRYLKGVKSEKLIFQKCDPALFKLYGYVDSDWESHRDTRRSRAGYIFKLGQCIVSWQSTLEPTVALSSAEAELMAATIAAKQAIYLRDLLAFLELPQDGPTVIFEDNSACIKLSRNSEFHKRTKHIDIRWFFVREKSMTNEVVLVKIDSKDNIADLFTKPNHPQQFHKFCAKLYEYYV
jgi:hypothetical protein